MFFCIVHVIIFNSTKVFILNKLPKVICLVGATGTGKTDVALALANNFNGLIINADSRQIYADFPIITAQPSVEEQKSCPHYLYGFLPSNAKISAGQWAAQAAALAKSAIEKGYTPIIVGGTGLYFRTLMHGIVNIPDIAKDISQKVYNECQEKGLEYLYKQLEKVDPLYAKRIHHNDKQRTMRALEVWEATGKNFTWWHENLRPEPLCRGIVIGIKYKLDKLTPRLLMRIKQMIKAGALNEARMAYMINSDITAPGWSGIGCMELLQYIMGINSYEQTCYLWGKNTRAYAKRQITWFKSDKCIHWFEPQELSNINELIEDNYL